MSWFIQAADRCMLAYQPAHQVEQAERPAVPVCLDSPANCAPQQHAVVHPPFDKIAIPGVPWHAAAVHPGAAGVFEQAHEQACGCRGRKVDRDRCGIGRLCEPQYRAVTNDSNESAHFHSSIILSNRRGSSRPRRSN